MDGGFRATGEAGPVHDFVCHARSPQLLTPNSTEYTRPEEIYLASFERTLRDPDDSNTLPIPEKEIAQGGRVYEWFSVSVSGRFATRIGLILRKNRSGTTACEAYGTR